MSSGAKRNPWASHAARRSAPSPTGAWSRTQSPSPSIDPPPFLLPLPASVSAEPVRLVAPTVGNPFAPGREVAFARVEGSLLEGLGVRDGDHVALDRRDAVEHGDLAAVVGLDGRAGLWKVYPEGDVLRLSVGDPLYRLRSGDQPRVHGVVVGVLRKFG